MTSRKNGGRDDARAARNAAHPVCAELHADDGPARKRRRETHERQERDRKTLQLCAQVRRVLHGALPSAAAPRFEALVVEAVEAVTDASRLRVVVSMSASQAPHRSEIKRFLEDRAGRFRSEVASHIHRKRVPLLIFHLTLREESP